MTEAVPDKDLVLIASAGRTGTMFLGRHLGAVIDDCFSVHEPDIWSLAPGRLFERQKLTALRNFGPWHMGPGRLLGRTGLRAHGKRHLAGEVDLGTTVRAIRAQRARYYRSIPEGMIVESYPAWWMFADVIDRIWPGCALIGVVRDPRDWIRSFQRHHPHRRDASVIGRLMPKPIDPDRLGDRYWADRWDSIGHAGRLAWEWALVGETLLRASGANPRIRIYRFEDLFGSDGAAMRDLVGFVAGSGRSRRTIGDMVGFTRQVENASAPGDARLPGWTAEDERIVAEICGPLMARWGYGGEPGSRSLARH